MTAWSAGGRLSEHPGLSVPAGQTLTASTRSGHCRRPARAALAPGFSQAPSRTVYAEVTCGPGDRRWSRPEREPSVTGFSMAAGWERPAHTLLS